MSFGYIEPIHLMLQYKPQLISWMIYIGIIRNAEIYQQLMLVEAISLVRLSENWQDWDPAVVTSIICKI